MTSKALPKNPFPPSAVATTASALPSRYIVPTRAMKDAQRHIDSFLAARPDESSLQLSGSNRNGGIVLAIAGEYGTGKTTLALDLVDRIAAKVPTADAVFMDAPSESFLLLYQERFLPRLSRSVLRDRVLALFSDVVVKELQKSEMMGGAAEAIATGAITAFEAIDRFGLMGSQMIALLQERIAEITRFPDLALILSYILFPEREDAVWNWLAGSGVHSKSALGIEDWGPTDAAALDMISALTYLLGATSPQLVLILDELEKLVPALVGPENSDSAISFKRLAEVCITTGAVLILAGLPDYLEALPKDLRDRISVEVRPTPLTLPDLRRVISRRVGGTGGSTEPFSDDAIERIHEICQGNPRQCLRTCYSTFENWLTKSAARRTSGIQPSDVDAVAKENLAASDAPAVRSSVRRALDRLGLEYGEHITVQRPSGESRSLDFWISFGDGFSGCAVVVAEPVLTTADAAELGDIVSTVRDPTKGRFSVLVLTGPAPPPVHAHLEEYYDRIVVFTQRDFAGDIEASIAGFHSKISSALRDDTIARLAAALESLQEQQANLGWQISDLLEGGLRGITGASNNGGRLTDSGLRLLPATSFVFDQFERWLRSIRAVIEGGSFMAPDGPNDRDDPHSSSYRRRGVTYYWSAQFLAELGKIALLEIEVDGFRQRVVSLVARRYSSQVWSSRDLQEICSDFDSLAERIHLSVDDLLGGPEAVSLVERSILQSSGSLAVVELGRNVYRAAVEDLSRLERRSAY